MMKLTTLWGKGISDESKQIANFKKSLFDMDKNREIDACQSLITYDLDESNVIRVRKKEKIPQYVALHN